MVKRLRNRLAGLMMAVLCAVGVVSAQSPNTASMVVTVVDQNDAVVKGANVSVVNNATGATREATSGDEGTATFAGLPLTGDYRMSVSMTGFAEEAVSGLTLHAGETAA